MEATGIVAEYNPFHNGHLYHLRETKKLTGQPLIIIMSGSLVQRGEPAFGNKWLRARLAVEQGAALVLELPAAFTLRSAEFFALGAVKLLQATGCVNSLSCGVEHPETDFLALAQLCYSKEFCQQLQLLLKQGLPYAAAQEQALKILGGQDGLHSPNDILALEYTKALLDTSLKPLYLQREQSDYNDTTIKGTLASATAIRQAYIQGKEQELHQALPPQVYTSLQQDKWGYDSQLLWQLLRYQLTLLTPQAIAASCQCSEGLENLLKQAEGCNSFAEALNFCTRKRYPRSRIRRLFLQLLLHKQANSFAQIQPAYLRVLAFNDEGRQLLKEMKHRATLPLITKLGKNPTNGKSLSFQQQLELDLAASDLLNLLQGAALSPHSDYLLAPYYQKNK